MLGDPCLGVWKKGEAETKVYYAIRFKYPTANFFLETPLPKHRQLSSEWKTCSRPWRVPRCLSIAEVLVEDPTFLKDLREKITINKTKIAEITRWCVRNHICQNLFDLYRTCHVEPGSEPDYSNDNDLITQISLGGREGGEISKER